METKIINYGQAIHQGFDYLLHNYPEVFVMGQGLWSPWYVGNSMTDLEKKYGIDRVIDTPVSESATTGAALGAGLAGMKPIIVHPRMDFMLYGVDAIVNQAAKWCHMMGGQDYSSLTIRAIINRGGEHGAQHSQALHAWFAHIPGLRVVMPSSVADARDLLIYSVLSKDPVIYIDDRWLYDQEDVLDDIQENDLFLEGPKVIRGGNDITIVGSSFCTYQAIKVAEYLENNYISPEIIDLRVISPLKLDVIIKSVEKTRRLLVLDSGNLFAGFSAEIIASVCEKIDTKLLISKPLRIALPNSPAPTPTILENTYYPSIKYITKKILNLFNKTEE